MNRFIVYFLLLFYFIKTTVINITHGLPINHTQVYVGKELRKMHSVFVNDNEKEAFLNSSTDHVMDGIKMGEDKYSDKNSERIFLEMDDFVSINEANNQSKRRIKRFFRNRNLETRRPVTMKPVTRTPETPETTTPETTKPETTTTENIKQDFAIEAKCSDILDVLVKNDDEIIDMEKQSKIYSTLIKKDYEKNGQQLLNNVFKNPNFPGYNKNENVNYNFLVNLVNIFTKYLYLNNKIEFESLKDVNIEYDCMNPQFIYISYNKYLKNEELDLNSIYNSCEYESFLNRKNEITDKDLDHNGKVLDPKNKLYYRFDFFKKNIKAVELSKDYFLNDKKFPLLARYKRYRSSKDGYLGYETCWFYPYYQIKDLKEFYINLHSLINNSYNFCSSEIIDPLNLIGRNKIGYEIDEKNNVFKITKNHIQEMICSMKKKAFTKKFTKCLTKKNNDGKYLNLCEKDKLERMREEKMKKDIEKIQEFNTDLKKISKEKSDTKEITSSYSQSSIESTTENEFSVDVNPELYNQDLKKHYLINKNSENFTNEKLTEYKIMEDKIKEVNKTDPYLSKNEGIDDYDDERSMEKGESKTITTYEEPFKSECVDKLVNECIHVASSTTNNRIRTYEYIFQMINIIFIWYSIQHLYNH